MPASLRTSPPGERCGHTPIHIRETAMQRTLITPPVLGGALAELKHWLAITTTQDDASLEALLRAAVETCEAFTGTMPVAARVEQIHAATCEWQALHASPVHLIDGAEAIGPDGTRAALGVGDYDIYIIGDSRGLVRLRHAVVIRRVSVRFLAGLVPDWEALPDGLRHGVLRLAAHNYRMRDGESGPNPPAAIAALWRPWRRLRL